MCVTHKQMEREDSIWGDEAESLLLNFQSGTLFFSEYPNDKLAGSVLFDNKSKG